MCGNFLTCFIQIGVKQLILFYVMVAMKINKNMFTIKESRKTRH